jgi:hypothetical protein
MGMRLERLTIRAFEDQEFSKQSGEEFTVWMNPESYKRTLNVSRSPVKEIRGKGSTTSFSRIGEETLAMTLIFDTTGLLPSPLGSDRMPQSGVVEILEPLIQKMAKVSPRTGEPYYLQLSWAQLQARCVLSSMSVDYKLFRPDGTPIRASVQLSFNSYSSSISLSRTSATTAKQSTQFVTVSEGESLPSLCNRIYGRSDYYLDVARYNGIFAFRKLKTGSRLKFPPASELL